MCDIFLFSLNTVIIMTFFVWDQHRVFVNAIITWVHHIDTTKITVLRFVWYRLVFTEYNYYRDLFCSGTALRLRNRHRHVWVYYIDTTKITVWCMSLLLLSIYLRWLCYFIMLYFKLTNGEMVKWWMVKWFNSGIKNRTGRFFSHKYQICLLTTSTSTKFIA